MGKRFLKKIRTFDWPNKYFNDFPNCYDVRVEKQKGKKAPNNEIQFYPTKATFLGTPDLK